MKLIIVFTLLTITTICNAGFQVGIERNGQTTVYNDSMIYLTPATWTTITIIGDQQQAANKFTAYLYSKYENSGYLAGSIGHQENLNYSYAISSAFKLKYGTGYKVETGIILPTSVILPGPWFDFEYVNAAKGDIITFWLDPNTQTPLKTIIIVPEPATLFLLGIGGLLLRRKK